MPGPPRKPTRLKLLEGNPGHQKLNKHEPAPLLATPVPPEWLKEDGLSEWNRIVPELDRLGMLTVVDQGALEGACAAYGQAVKCHKYLEQHGLTMSVGDGGYEQQRPEVSIEQKAWTLYRGFTAEFGLTPSARGKLSIGDQQKKRDSVEDAMCG